MTRRRTRVLMVNDSLNVGGAERVAVDIANSLDRDHFDVRFCATRVGGPLRERIRDDVPVRILGRTATWDIRKIAEFVKLVRSEEIDLIHSHGRGTMKFVALGRATGLVAARHVFHDHFGWLHIDRGAGRGLRVALQRHVDAYIGVDERLCGWARSTVGLPAERVHLIRSGVDVNRFSTARADDLRAEFGLPEESVVLVMVANFRPQKDHPTLFRAIAALPDDARQRLRLLVCGSTSADTVYYASCMEMVERLEISEQVRVIGARDDVASLLAGADGAVLSSKNETGPLVVLEYMASGLPFVATDTGEITRAVRDLGVGFVPAPRDHKEVADALEALVMATPEQRRAMGAEGRRQVELRFAQPVVTREIEGVYRSVLGEPPVTSDARPASSGGLPTT